MDLTKLALDGLQAKLVGDATLTALLATDTEVSPAVPAISEGFPDDLLETPVPASFPRVTYQARVQPVVAGFYRVTLELIVWWWPTGSTGGTARRDAISAELVELLDDSSGTRWWRYTGAGGTVRISAIVATFQDLPVAGSGPGQRLMLLSCLVSG